MARPGVLRRLAKRIGVGGAFTGAYAAPKVEFPLGAKGQIVAFAKEGVGHAGELNPELRHV